MSKGKFWKAFMYLLSLAIAIGLVMGIRAGTNDPRSHILLAFMGLAFPFFLLGHALLFVYWLFKRKWWVLIVQVGLIIYGWHSVKATFGLMGDSGSDKKENPADIRLLTYNVHNFKPYGENITAESKDKIFKAVVGQMPDVVCFQEFYTRERGDFDTIDSLRELLKMDYHFYVPTQKSTKESIGLAIFSRYPIVDQGYIHFKDTKGNGSIYTDLLIGEKTVRFYNVHLQSISFDKQDYSYLDQVTKELDPKMAPSKRILRMLRSAFKKRSEQVSQMKEHIRTCSYPYVLAGDFNDTPASYAVTQMTDSLQNAFVKQGWGFGKTYNGKFPNFQIDYIAATPQFEILNYQVIKVKVSDHFPVRSDLRFIK